jgi:hypothetical protein
LKIDPEKIDLLPWLFLFHPKDGQELIGVESFSINFPIEFSIQVAGSSPEVSTAPFSVISYTI